MNTIDKLWMKNLFKDLNFRKLEDIIADNNQDINILEKVIDQGGDISKVKEEVQKMYSHTALCLEEISSFLAKKIPNRIIRNTGGIMLAMFVTVPYTINNPILFAIRVIGYVFGAFVLYDTAMCCNMIRRWAAVVSELSFETKKANYVATKKTVEEMMGAIRQLERIM